MKWTNSTALMIAVALAACDGGTGPDHAARLDVRLAGGIGASQLMDGAGMPPLSLEAVDSIVVDLTAVEAARLEEGEERWVRLDLAGAAAGRLDLLRLPAGEEGIQLARGDVEAGTYTSVRLRYDAATARIVLNRAVTVGQQTYAAGSYGLQVPSGEQNGIRIQLQNLVVQEDQEADVVLLFDAAATVPHVVATGSGKLLLTPVLRARSTIDD